MKHLMTLPEALDRIEAAQHALESVARATPLPPALANRLAGTIQTIHGTRAHIAKYERKIRHARQL